MAVRLALAAAACVLAGCSSGGEPTLCHEGMPRASQLLADPAFAELKYHVHQEPNWNRPVGSDLWGDARFDYTTGIQYLLVPAKDRKSVGDLCAFAVSMRFAIPAREVDQRKLRAFAQAVAPAAKIEPGAFEAQLAEVLRSGDKFRPRAMANPLAVEAGKLFHPTRGDFFLVTVTWPTPWITAR